MRTTTRSRVWVRTLVAAAASLGAATAVGGTPAVGLPSECSAAGTTVTCTYTSGSNPFTVPAGVIAVHVDAVGGTGERPLGGAPGGAGAHVAANLAVTPGSTLYAVVGGNGGNVTAGGANGGRGGGSGGIVFCLIDPPFCLVGGPGGAGGGASDVRTAANDLGSRLLVAAGGGGGGGFGATMFSGNSPGSPGAAAGASAYGTGGGAAGTSSGGGVGGPGVCFLDVICASAGAAGGRGAGGGGGDGAQVSFTPSSAASGGGGGGGGGGWYGGGGGGGDVQGGGFGGGGGSNRVPFGGSQAIDTTGVPMVQISYSTLPVVLPGTASVMEGDAGTTTLHVPVSLSGPSTQTVTVQWTTSFAPGAPSGFAEPGVDFTPASGTVMFAPGETTATVPLTVTGDTLVEPDEWVLVAFGNPTNATVGGFYGLGFGGITNDDHTVVLPGTASVLEGDAGTTMLALPVSLSQPSTQTVTVEWTTSFASGAPAGFAEPGTDFTSATGTVTFAPGETISTVSIAVAGDTLVEPDELIVVGFSHPTNATVGGFYGLGFGAVVDDD